MYLRHIARLRDYKEIGKKLLKYFLKLAKDRDVNYIICEILEKYPKNEKSIKFFTANNFQRVGSIIYEDNLYWGLYLLKI